MTASIHPIHRPRTLEQILGEIQIERTSRAASLEVWRATRSEVAEAGISVADERLWNLKAEAMNMIREQTGCSYSVISSYLD